MKDWGAGIQLHGGGRVARYEYMPSKFDSYGSKVCTQKKLQQSLRPHQMTVLEKTGDYFDGPPCPPGLRRRPAWSSCANLLLGIEPRGRYRTFSGRMNLLPTLCNGT